MRSAADDGFAAPAKLSTACAAERTPYTRSAVDAATFGTRVGSAAGVAHVDDASTLRAATRGRRAARGAARKGSQPSARVNQYLP